MTRLLDLIDRLRRPPMTVLWGGRPGIDYQLGSPADLRRAAHLAYRARLERESRERIARITDAMRKGVPAMNAVQVRLGVNVAQAIRSLRAFAEAVDRVGATVEAERQRRYALSRAAAKARADLELRRALRGPR